MHKCIIISNFCSVNFDAEWPFGTVSNNEKTSDEKCKTCIETMTNDAFQETTREAFNEFVAKIEVKRKKLIVISFL